MWRRTRNGAATLIMLVVSPNRHRNYEDEKAIEDLVGQINGRSVISADTIIYQYRSLPFSPYRDVRYQPRCQVSP
jgi:hypothetical protein